MEISFPTSKCCLWDGRSTGETVNLHLTSSGWIQLKVKSNVIDMAVQHSARQSCDSEAWLMGTPVVTKECSVILEVNRFDPGKWVKTPDHIRLHPTIVLPGDIAIHCKVMDRSLSDNTDGILTHNLSTLQDAYSLLDQRINGLSPFDCHLLLSLRFIIIKIDAHRILLKGGCVLPSTVARMHPISPIPLFPSALSRNLTGSHPLSLVQGGIRIGYLSMDKCRKLVPLLPSDTSVQSLPLVGMWVSGTNSIDHPGVWSAALHYVNTSNDIERVYGRQCDFLILLPGRDSQLWQCSLTNEGNGKWTWHIGQTTQQKMSMTTVLELMPAIEGTAAHTLLESSENQWQKYLNRTQNDSLPLPAPTPLTVPSIVGHDTDLSCISGIEESHQVSERVEQQTVSTDLLLKQQKQLEALQEQVLQLLEEQQSNSSKEANIQTTPTANVATNTGQSLLEGLPISYPGSGTMPKQSVASDEERCRSNSNSSGTLTPPISPPTISSLTNTTLLSRNLTSPEYSYCSTFSLDSEPSTVADSTVVQHQVYQQLKNQIEEFLGSSSCDVSLANKEKAVTDDKENVMDTDFSLLNVPKIKFTGNEISYLSETTIDSHSNVADAITQRYLSASVSTNAADSTSSSQMEYSTDTQRYLTRHGLLPTDSNTHSNILDIERLRNIPKLI